MHVLVIEDEPSLRDLYRRLLVGEGYTVTTAVSLGEADQQLARQPFDLIMSDVRLPDGRGTEQVLKWKTQAPSRPVLLLTAYGNVPDCAKAIKAGAYDYLVKGDDDARILPTLAAALSATGTGATKASTKDYSSLSLSELADQNPDLAALITPLHKVAKTQLSVLLLGPSGAGKEVLAKAIHAASGVTGSWVPVNCAAIPEQLLESEFFGHAKGAFTGATADKKGWVQEAKGGTLFLDEVGELPALMQAKLLRLLEDGSYYRVGDTKPQKAEFRLIAATNQNLADRVAQGLFREDLYYRINDYSVSLPSLKDRPADTQAFILRYFHENNKEVKDAVLKFLLAYSWPGNMRQLKKVLQRMVLMSDDAVITENDLPLELLVQDHEAPQTFNLAEVEKHQIVKVLAHTGGQKQQAAELLGIGLATLYRKLKEYGI